MFSASLTSPQKSMLNFIACAGWFTSDRKNLVRESIKSGNWKLRNGNWTQQNATPSKDNLIAIAISFAQQKLEEHQPMACWADR